MTQTTHFDIRVKVYIIYAFDYIRAPLNACIPTLKNRNENEIDLFLSISCL